MASTHAHGISPHNLTFAAVLSDYQRSDSAGSVDYLNKRDSTLVAKAPCN